MEAMILLVNSQHGVYCHHVLLKNYRDNLYYKGELFELSLKREGLSIEDVFHPDATDWCESVDWYMPDLTIKASDSDIHHRVESIEGDIWAIDPNAEWSDEKDTYIMPTEE